LNYICLDNIKQGMKKIVYVLLSFILLNSCGSSSSGDSDTNNEEVVKEMKGFEELDLTPWGFEMSLMIPNAEKNGDPEVTLTERGALEIVIGKGFGIEILFGEGNLKLLKTDLEEHPFFETDIIKEEKDALVYKQVIPNSEVKERHHFFYRIELGNDIYEIMDLKEGEFDLNEVEKMLSSAKSIKHKLLTPAGA